MNNRIFWTTAALLTAALGVPLASHAQQNQTQDHPASTNNQATSPQAAPPTQPVDVIKVGEYQSLAGQTDSTVIARVGPHTVAASRPAATLYVRNTPILTFLGSGSAPTNSDHKVGAIKATTSADSTNATQVATTGKLPAPVQASSSLDSQTTAPVWRAALVAAKLNQLNQENLDANKITVRWQPVGKTSAQKPQGKYLIEINGQELVEINSQVQLADTTHDPAKDALAATNRLRQILGNAPPLKEISGLPKPPSSKQIALGPIRISLTGLASWYGSDFQGSPTASGEPFNQNALTAANRTLPLGTRVRVTNMSNGRSVVVRINDRGPYVQGRIIDLSTAAARVLGLLEAGVAPVRVDVLGNQASASANQ